MLRIFKHHIPLWSLLELIADSVLCFVAVLMAVAHLPGGPFDPKDRSSDTSEPFLWAAAFAVLMALLYSFVGLYRSGAIQVGVRGMLARGFMALFLGSCVAYLSLQADGSEQHALVLLIYAVPVMAIGVVAVRSLGYLARRACVGGKRVLIVGTGLEAQGVAQQLGSDPLGRYSVVGFYPTGKEGDHAAVRGQVFKDAISIDDLVREHRVSEVIVAVREQRGGNVPMADLLACRIRGTPVLDLAGFYEHARGEVPTDSVKASWLVYGHGFAQGGMRTAIKRAFDVIGSLALLLVAAPIMVITAAAIKLESRGPVIYRQERVGLGGLPFMCLKFRSMSVDAEKDGVARWATHNDARVTRIGAFIRKCRIDELPQLISVLRGEMSLVGPRPERPSFVDQLKHEIPFYEVRHCVKPGVTGWAQVRYSYGASVEDARRKHQFDLYYVKNHSLFLDLIVLIETVSVVLFREGAR